MSYKDYSVSKAHQVAATITSNDKRAKKKTGKTKKKVTR